MIAPHLNQLLSEHHIAKGSSFTTLLTELCESIESGSSCLPLDHSSLKSSDINKALACDEIGSVVGSPNNHQPLILTEKRKLYFNRYYSYEKEIAQAIIHRAKASLEESTPSLQSNLTDVFEEIDGNDQAEAARKAAQQNFSIISGGPGTGKTTTVVKILSLLKKIGFYNLPDEVMLLAPTGKAADRLRHSILKGLEHNGVDPNNFPTTTSTIHRALGYRPHSTEFRHDQDSPLPAKVIVVDETSMVDLPLMAKLFRAIQPNAKIILLGDQHQLTSVEVGSVLADCIEKHTDQQSLIHHTTTILRKSYRNQGFIHQVCQSIKAGDSTKALSLIQSSDPQQLGHVSIQPLPTQPKATLTAFVRKHWLASVLGTELSTEQRLMLIDNFRILCPTHQGPYGINTLNATVEAILRSEGLDTSEKWYEGRSIIIQQNDHSLGIYNGDTGLCVRDEENQIKVAFLSEESVRLISPNILPEAKTAWALTIHRTQGSEYEELLLALPQLSEDNTLVTRELLYTGLSRAKNKATIWSDHATFESTIKLQAQRASGLSDLL